MLSSLFRGWIIHTTVPNTYNCTKHIKTVPNTSRLYQTHTECTRNLMTCKSPTTIRVFASHDWGVDNANHERVAAVVKLLKRRGIGVWFDETHMKGNILDAMCSGIDSSDVVLVFVTQNYLDKVERGKATDNVKLEFMYAKDKPNKMLAIRFENTLPSKWNGPVGMVLGSHLYTDLSITNNRSIDALVTAIQNTTQSTLWKHAARKGIVAQAIRRVPPRQLPLATQQIIGARDIRARVHLALNVMGDCIRTDEHTGAALDRILLSIAGAECTALAMPFHKKIAFVEEQLGI